MKRIVLLTALFSSFARPAQAESPKAMDAARIMDEFRMAHFYAGKDRIVHHRLEIHGKGGKSKRTREFTRVRMTVEELRRNKIFFYFYRPSKVKRLAMIIWKYHDRADDRWAYVPALDLIRRFPAMDERQSFVGSHYTYEDGIGRDVGLDADKLIREEKIAGRMAYVIESTPKDKDQFSKRILWIDKATFLPLKKETYDLRGKLWKVFTSEAMKNISAGKTKVPTVTRTRVKDVQSGEYSVMHYQEVIYDSGIAEDDFAERNLRTPPAAWLR